MSGPESPDPRPLTSQFAGDPDMAELIDLFLTELPKRLDDMAASWRAGDVQRAKTIAHQLRGSSGGYGYPTIGAAAARVEDAIRTPPTPDLTAIENGIQELRELCARAMRR
jgi:HPt (histidine-containing phosphotransfer) domain-containing protein